MNVPADFGAWLRSACLVATASSAEIEGAWGQLAAVGEVVSPLANQADADAEAARQLVLFGQPMVVEVLQVAGLRIDLLCRAVNLTAARQGYHEGATVFVIGVKEQDVVERTNLTVLRKLA
ncbi:hypothetical protein VVT58_15575 [Sphingobium sp. SJ10-10]|uniref:hypothetical protein n=1 Tax=Sphingobium sp. SJ10-10 TaxID=3114999 RepID=UPI002E1931D2|nr:hypothetical protein [Sphingobium sp. SJ10-10]